MRICTHILYIQIFHNSTNNSSAKKALLFESIQSIEKLFSHILSIHQFKCSCVCFPLQVISLAYLSTYLCIYALLAVNNDSCVAFTLVLKQLLLFSHFHCILLCAPNITSYIVSAKFQIFLVANEKCQLFVYLLSICVHLYIYMYVCV